MSSEYTDVERLVLVLAHMRLSEYLRCVQGLRALVNDLEFEIALEKLREAGLLQASSMTLTASGSRAYHDLELDVLRALLLLED